MKINIKRILLTILPVLLCAIVGSIFMKIGKVDYNKLEKPLLSPPGIAFPIAWSILYVLIGTSAYLFDKKVDNCEIKIKGLLIYYIGLFFNAFWTFFFFTLDMKVFASVWLGILYLISVSNFLIFYKNNKVSGYLLLPYLGWLIFALYLNVGTCILN